MFAASTNILSDSAFATITNRESRVKMDKLEGLGLDRSRLIDGDEVTTSERDRSSHLSEINGPRRGHSAKKSAKIDGLHSVPPAFGALS